MSLEGKMIILGVSGGIAAYKAATICSQLTQRGADVRVIMTESATKFVQPLTFQTLSRNHVYIDTFQEDDPSIVSHIDLADHADLVLVAPATANIIGKYANGLADDMLSTTLLATEAPVWLAPAMNGHMLQHPAVQHNINTLIARGVRVIQPGEGQLACGYVGKGRLSEPDEIIAEVVRYFQQDEHTIGNVLMEDDNVDNNLIRNDLLAWWKNKSVIVTAGPTREEIDPVRYLSNYSSGKMGYAIAEMAARYGANVTLVSGPVDLPNPTNVELVTVNSTEEMYQAVIARYPSADVVIKAAAVADYQPVSVADQKLKKSDEHLMIELKKTKDILQALGAQKTRQILIGFAAETHDVEKYALQKLTKKNLDMVVANDVTLEGAGFGTDTNIVTFYHRSGEKIQLSKLSKHEVAEKLLETVAKHYA